MLLAAVAIPKAAKIISRFMTVPLQSAATKRSRCFRGMSAVIELVSFVSRTPETFGGVPPAQDSNVFKRRAEARHNVRMLKKRLAKAGFTVVIATDGKQGIAMATSEQPDLILVDQTLPDIRGEKATQRMKAQSTTKQIPVIALNGKRHGWR